MKDSWCKLVRAESGAWVSGGAARNVRIAALGGMDTIIQDVAQDALLRADEMVRRKNARPKLKLVANGR